MDNILEVLVEADSIRKQSTLSLGPREGPFEPHPDDAEEELMPEDMVEDMSD